MIVQSKEMLTAIAQHKERRRREQTRAEPADDLAPLDDTGPLDLDGGDCRRDYANSVGMPLWEKIR